MKLFLLLILAMFASENENDARNDTKCEENPILVKIEEDEYAKLNKKSKFIGVSYHKKTSKWYAQRWNKEENRPVSKGYYDDEKAAAHASDTLARKLMENGGKKLKLNFPDEHIEHSMKKDFKFIGVFFHKKSSKWGAQRWSKDENRHIFNGYYDDEETAAHASDTFARKLMNSGEQNHKLNFPDDYTEVHKKRKAKYIGLSYHKNRSKWRAERWSKNENRNVYNGYYDDEKTAAHESDTLARKLMENGEQGHKLNFPDDENNENQNKKRTRSNDLRLKHHQNN